MSAVGQGGSRERRHRKNAGRRSRFDALEHQNETAVAEMRHRCATCFQVLSVLIQWRLRQTSSDEARAQLAWMEQIVATLTLLQRHLAAAGVEGSFATYLARQARFWRSLCAEQSIEIVLDTAEFDLPVAKVMPLAFATNELVMNCLEHAFPDGPPGRIRITFRKLEDGWAEVSVIDNGVGIGLQTERAASQLLGLDLVEELCAQADGVLSTETDGGTTARIRFALQ